MGASGSGGETGPVAGAAPTPILMTMSGFVAVAVYNSLEQLVVVLRTFRRRGGLYFWSMVAVAAGVPLHVVPNILRFFGTVPGPRGNLAMSALLSVGWWLMVTGQSVVLYSRLSLVVASGRTLRAALGLIVLVFVAVQLPTTAFFLACNWPDPAVARRYSGIYAKFEATQLVVITALETFISSLYVYEASHGLKRLAVLKKDQVKTVFRELVGLLVLVVSLDMTLIVLQFTGNYLIQATWKPVVYSVKLKVETLVLNNLVNLVQSRSCLCLDFPEENFSTRNSNWPKVQERRMAYQNFSVNSAARRGHVNATI